MKKITTILAIALSFSVSAQNDTMFIHTRDAVVEIPVEEIDSIVFHRTLPMSVSQPSHISQPASDFLPVAVSTNNCPRPHRIIHQNGSPDDTPIAERHFVMTADDLALRGEPGTRCPDHWCRSGACFWLTYNRWACCPVPGSTMCPGSTNCCPPGFSCEQGRCVRDGETLLSVSAGDNPSEYSFSDIDGFPDVFPVIPMVRSNFGCPEGYVCRPSIGHCVPVHMSVCFHAMDSGFPAVQSVLAFCDGGNYCPNHSGGWTDGSQSSCTLNFFGGLQNGNHSILQNNRIGDEIFAGEVRYFNDSRLNDSRKVVKNVTSKRLPLERRLNSGMIAVYDSLLFQLNHGFPDYSFNVFNVNTGKKIGHFVRSGQGPEEAIAVSNIVQFFKKGDELITILQASNENRLLFWNISRSIETGKTVFDAIIPYNLVCEFSNQPRYNRMFFLNKDTLLATALGNILSPHETTTPFFEKRSIFTDQLIRRYDIYKEPVAQMIGIGSGLAPSIFFHSSDALKPDGSKLVQGMRSLSQLNIFDIRTGEMVGHRRQNSPDFSLFQTDMQSSNIYYNSVQANNKYIFAVFWGKPTPRRGERVILNTIHVYDWHGNQLYKLITDRDFSHIWLDQIRNKLYTVNFSTGEAYYLNLNELGIRSN